MGHLLLDGVVSGSPVVGIEWVTCGVLWSIVELCGASWSFGRYCLGAVQKKALAPDGTRCGLPSVDRARR